MSTGNGRAALERDDTPQTPLLEVVRGAAKSSPAEAILMLANVTESAIAHSRMAEVAALAARDKIETLQAQIGAFRGDTQAELDAISGRVIVAFGAQAVAIQALKDALGEVPRTIDPKESRSGEHNAEQLAAMESGTGLAGIVGRMRAEQSRAARKQALSVGAAAAFAPVAVELIKAFF